MQVTAVTAYVGENMEHDGLLYYPQENSSIEQKPGTIYVEQYSSRSSTCHMFTYLITHITHAYAMPTNA